MRLAVAVGVLLAAIASVATAGPTDPVEQGATEQSCKSLQGGTAGTPYDSTDAGSDQFPATWPEAPTGLLPAHVYLRTETETFNRRFEFATRHGEIYGRGGGPNDPWRQLPLPLCFDGRVGSISLDDDEMIALDD